MDDARKDDLQSFTQRKIINPLSKLTNTELFNQLEKLHNKLKRGLSND